MSDRYRITQQAFQDLMKRVRAGEIGDESVFECDAQPKDHVHIRRLGAEGSRLDGRVAVAGHGAKGQAVGYFAAAEARQIAAAILNAADELDGVAPLVFVPRGPDEAEPDVVEEVAGKHRADAPRHRADGPA